MRLLVTLKEYQMDPNIGKKSNKTKFLFVA